MNEQVVNATENSYEVTFVKPWKMRELPIDWECSDILISKT